MMVHKIPSCAFRASPENSQILFRWMCDTAALQYFRFKPLHSQSNPIPIHAQARRQKAGPGAKVFGRKGPGEGEPFSGRLSNELHRKQDTLFP
ncbi:MAG: hypothetical protein ACLVI5_02565, partial [Desulfovibrio piger]